MSIRYKITILLLVFSIIPVVFLTIVDYHHDRKVLEEQIGVASLDYTRLLMDRITEIIYMELDNITNWSQGVKYTNLTMPDDMIMLSQFLRDVSGSYNRYNKIVVLNLQGQVLASNQRVPFGLSYKESPGFKAAVNREIHIGDVRPNKNNNKNKEDMTITMPITDRVDVDKMLAVLSVNVKWKYIQQLIRNILISGKEQNEADHIMLFDSTGKVLACHIKDQILESNLLDMGLPSAQKALERKEGYLTETSEHNLKAFSTYTYSKEYKSYPDYPNLNWGLVLHRDPEKIFAPITSLQHISITTVIAISTMLLLTSLFIGSKICNPVLSVASAATEIGKGNWNVKVPVKGADEIGLLSRSFNMMAKDIRRTESRYRLLVESAQQVICTVDENGILLFINKFGTLGLGLNPNNCIGKSMWELFTKPYADKNMKLIRNALKSNGHINANYEIVVNREKRWYQVNIWPSPDSESKTKSVLIIANDITSQKHAEAAMEESENKYRNLFESANDATFIMDVSEEHGARFLDCNKSTLELFGCTHRNQIIGKTPDMFSPKIQPDGQPSYEKAMKLARLVMDGFPQRFEWEHVRFDGSIFLVDVTLKRFELEDKLLMLAVVRDITEWKKAQKELKESQERFRMLSDFAYEGIVIHHNRTILDANRTFMNMFGYDENEIFENDGIELVAPEERQNVENYLANGYEGGYETIGLRKDGSRFPMEIDIRKIEYRGRQCRVASLRDLTERKQIETKLREFSDRVLQYQKYAYVNSMGAIVAHQLRQPLSVLSMLLPKIQKENIELVVCPTILDDVGECIMQAKKASSIITNFTKYAKEPFSESIGQVSVKKTGKSVISLLSSKAKQHNIDIQFEPSDDLQDIRISSTALEQIFFILIQNAIEAAGNSKKHKINISAESNGEFIELKFADDCGGIPEEDIDMIFEPFFSTKEQGKGTGLGLEIIQRILMNYGGKIEVDSIFGKGSTFNVAVPVNTDII